MTDNWDEFEIGFNKCSDCKILPPASEEEQCKICNTSFFKLCRECMFNHGAFTCHGCSKEACISVTRFDGKRDVFTILEHDNNDYCLVCQLFMLKIDKRRKERDNSEDNGESRSV